MPNGGDGGRDVLLIKAGGGKGLNWPGICRNIAGIFPETPVVLVHGANAERDGLAARLGVDIRTVESPSGVSSVYTDAGALDIFLMAYPGLVNTRITALLLNHGVNAVGLSGVDGRLWQARARREILVRSNGKVKVLRGNMAGTVEKADASLPRLLLESGRLPVVCPPALSFDGEIVNTDGDTAAAVLAGALGVKCLICLFEAPGLLGNPDDETSLVPKIERDNILDTLAFARGRMKKKILGARKAFEGGVETVVWGDGRTENPVLDALAGKGTVIR